jgi:hypothetical protein
MALRGIVGAMIPYDDLVAALQQWRARQGLPVSTMGGGGTAAAPQPGSGPHTASGSYGQPASGPYGQAGSGPYGQPGSGPARGAPPAPPRGKQPSVPPPLAMDDAMHEVDDAEMLEEQYETEGSDFAMPFGGNTEDTTAGAPERPTDPNDFNGNGRRGGGGGRDDW